jgi:hypothetical protein
MAKRFSITRFFLINVFGVKAVGAVVSEVGSNISGTINPSMTIGTFKT